MKISLNWVKEFVSVDLSIDELVTKIGAQLGAVEEVVDIGKKYQGIVIAKIVKCQKHQGADKLNVCTIDDGGNTPDVNRDENGYVQVVCGAPNARDGILVAWLPPGTTVPSSFDKDPFVLEARDIRGVVSNGMLASSHELALSDDHSGIVELSYGEPGADFGKTLGLDDYIIDIENKMFTHRPDCFGILGVAREIAGITGQQFKSPEWYAEEVDVPSVKNDLHIDVENKIPDQVPRFMAQVIQDVDVKTSPAWMQAYLTRSGIRPINNIVDATNYAMHLTGQPLHAYDYDKLCKVAGTESAQLETRFSKKGDELKLLNGKSISFEDEETILITSNDVPVGIGGIMGGADTEVDEATKRIVLECANFNLYTIRRASMRHGLFTDAVTRFNKGQSSLQNPSILLKTTGWVTQLAGGEPGETVDNYQKLEHPRSVQVSSEFINTRLGITLDAEKITQLLLNVELQVIVENDNLIVTAPFWRTDINISEDIVEEVGRLYGYDHIPLQLPARSIVPAVKNNLHEFKQKLRDILSSAGANEVLTYSFVHGRVLERAGQKPEDSYKLTNAISPDLQYYRQSLQPSLLDKVHLNIKAGINQFAIYEIGKTHNKVHGIGEDGLPGEIEMLGLTYASKHALLGAAYYEARAYLDFIASKLGLELDYAPIEADPGYPVTRPYEYSRSALVSVKNGPFLGQVGEYRTEVIQNFKLPIHAAGFEIGTTELLKAVQVASSSYETPGKYPSVSQDITLKVPVSAHYADLKDTLNTALDKLKPEHSTTTLTLSDIYQKEESDEYKNVTFRLQIASNTHTLQDEVVNTLLDEIAAHTKESLKAERI